MHMTPDQAVAMIDGALTTLSETLKATHPRERKKLWARVDKLLDNRLKMMKERDA